MSCKVYLDNYAGVYSPGSEIRGRVECYFKDETTVRGIKVRLKCKEFNQWTSTETYTDHNNKSQTRTVTNTGDHNVVNIEQMLFGSGSGTRQLGRGKHVHSFIFILPQGIPSSYHGPYGYIAYKIKGVVDRPMRGDYEDVINFNVMAPIDLNYQFKNCQEPVTYSDEKTICCWCCRGGNISLDVELPKTAYAVGERVPFKVHILNMSNSNVEDLKIKLEKEITFRVDSPNRETKSETDKILVINEHGVGAHGEHTYDLTLDIPEHIEVPNFDSCDLFSVEYRLKVNCSMPSCVLDLDISIYPKLGHIASVIGTEQPATGYPSENLATAPPYQPGFIGTNPADNGNIGIVPVPPLPVDGGAICPPYPPAGPIGFAPPSDIHANSNSLQPSAPSSGEDAKAREAEAGSYPIPESGPSGYELPPPTYDEAYQKK